MNIAVTDRKLQEQVKTLMEAVEAGIDYELELQGRISSLQAKYDESERGFKAMMAEKATRFLQLGEEVAQLKEKVNAANQMRDITLELVRRFTSIQITALGTQTTPHGQVIGENSPYNLAKVIRL